MIATAPLRRYVLRAIAASLLVLAGAAIGFLIGQRRAPGGDAIDQPLMAFLSEARALHHRADIEEKAGDIAGATRTIERVVTAHRPENAPEIDEVLADAYARLAELELRRDAVDAAERAVQKGLSTAPEATYFRGHLVEIGALVEEARAAALADAGRANEAAAARTRAMTLLEEAVKIQDHVIQIALDDAGGPR